MRWTKWLYASSAGIAAKRPAAVLMSASLMPGATAVIDDVCIDPIVANASMIPQTVPKSPMKGDAAAVVARNGRYREMRADSIREARSSDRSTLSSERMVAAFACAICASISA